MDSGKRLAAAVSVLSLYAGAAQATLYTYDDSFVPSAEAGGGSGNLTLTYNDQSNLFGFGLTLDAPASRPPRERDMFWLTLSDDGAYPDSNDFTFWFGNNSTRVNAFGTNNWTYFDEGLSIMSSADSARYEITLDVTSLLAAVGSNALFTDTLGLWFYGDYGVGRNYYQWGALADEYYASASATQVPEPSTPLLLLAGLVALAGVSLARRAYASQRGTLVYAR